MTIRCFLQSIFLEISFLIKTAIRYRGKIPGGIIRESKINFRHLISEL